MQFFNSQSPWSSSNLPAIAPRSPLMNTPAKPALGPCGWYESSFDLHHGLDVDEQDNDTLYQLWELAQN